MTERESASDLDDDTEEFLRQWAAGRAGDDPKFAEALQGLLAAYLALAGLGEIRTIREFLNLLPAPQDGALRQSYLLDAKLRAATGLPGGQIYKRLRALETETGLKFAALERRRKFLQQQDEESQQTEEHGRQ